MNGAGNAGERMFSIFLASSNVAFESLTLANGTELSSSGGTINATNSHSVSILNSTITGSSADSFGGAVRGGTDLLVANSTFTNNTSARGGAITISNGNLLTIVNSSFTGNVATDDTYGGGAIATFGTTNIYNSTFTGNASASVAGAIVQEAGALSLFNSIVAGNNAATGDDDVDGTITSNGANIFGSAVAGSAGGDMTLDGMPGNALTDVFDSVSSKTVGGTTFDSGDLANNGGPTQTTLILANGLAEDSGITADIPTETTLGIDVDGDGTISAVAVDVDQRGSDRVTDTLVDIGAVESDARLFLVVDTLTDEDDGDYSAGDLSLREALALVDDGGTIFFDAALTGGMTAGVDDGQIVLNGTQLVISRDVTINGRTNGNYAADITIDGGAASRVFNLSGSGTEATLRSLDITNGDTTGNGGAINAANNTTLNLVNSTVRDSVATGNEGGGIFLYGGTASIVNSTVSGNTSAFGGGIYAFGGSDVTLVNTTVDNNTATSTAGGINAGSLGNAATLTILNSTITNNDATGFSGGGLFLYSGSTATVNNSIVALNTSAGVADVAIVGAGSALTANSSFFGTNVTIASGTGNLNNAGDPLLGALADNGGTVQTRALQIGSLAIGGGDDALFPVDTFDLDGDGNTAEDLPEDANGRPREIGITGLDIGAVEFDEGDTFGETASTAGSVTVGGGALGEIHFDGDEDWFAVTLTAGQSYLIELGGVGSGGGTLADPFLRGVFDSDEFQIPGKSNDDNGVNLDSSVFFFAEVTGEHYISAGASGGVVGTYTLSVDVVLDDFGETAGLAGSVTLGTPATGEIDAAGDQDWFAIDFVAGTNYRIDLEGHQTGQGTLLDPFLRGIYDPNEVLIPNTENDDGGTGTNSRLTYTATTTGTHYIDAGAFQVNSGTYTVSVLADAVTLRDDMGAVQGTFFTIAGATAAAADGFTIEVDGATYTAGPETVSTSLENLTFDLPNGVAPVITLGGTAISLTAAGTGSPEFVGNGEDNILTGAAGTDTLRGGTGNDRYYVDNTTDVVIEGVGEGLGDFIFSSVSFTSVANAERLYLTGTANIDATGVDAQSDILIGNTGDNNLDGLSGIDTLIGGLGNDRYYVDNAGDTVDEVTGGGGIADFIFSTVSYATSDGIERLYLEGTANINATGRDGFADILIGNDGNNILDGKGGADVMRGGLGNDFYFVDDAGDTVDEVTGGGGVADYIFSTVSYATSDGIERLYLEGMANIDATGRDGATDILIGNSSDNTLDGKGGVDVMRGGLGNDFYYVDNAGDIVDEVTGGGGASDLIFTTTTYQIAAGAERLIAIEGAAGAVGLTARNNQNDIVIGNSGTNVFIDQFGRDTFVGGGGSDFFRFIANLDGVNNVNRINDFDAADDQFQLQQTIYSQIGVGILNASQFVLGAAAGDADDRIIYDSTVGKAYYDPDGTGATAQIEIVNVDIGTIITADDFQIF